MKKRGSNAGALKINQVWYEDKKHNLKRKNEKVLIRERGGGIIATGVWRRGIWGGVQGNANGLENRATRGGINRKGSWGGNFSENGLSCQTKLGGGGVSR